jgi:formamidopyrimidine-DNA glycosylase
LPELPEVETIRLKLMQEIKGKTIASVSILEKKQFVGDPQDILRKGKYLSIKIQRDASTSLRSAQHDIRSQSNVTIEQLNNPLYLNIHLKMSGQIIYVSDINNAVIKNNLPRMNTNKLPVKSTRVIIEFTDHSALFYNDMRKFGWIKISKNPDGPSAHDVMSTDFTLEYFQNSLQGSKLPIKMFLLDQTKLAGVGNIYANDALWAANILPTRKAGELTNEEGKKLYNAILKTIQEGIRYKGSSAKDENYIMPDGSLGEYQKHFKVYSREGEPCLTCGKKIVRIKQGGRSSFYCLHCQR